MQMVRKFPDLWMGMTMDGFGSHLEPQALEVFVKHHILLVREEGHFSHHVCQSYNQFIAKDDKRHLCSLMQGYRINVPVVSNFELIFIANSVMNEVRAKDSQRSFKWVNLRPSCHVPFKKYITKVQSVVVAGDFFFHEQHGMHAGRV